jgi:hypothetical protein
MRLEDHDVASQMRRLDARVRRDSPTVSCLDPMNRARSILACAAALSLACGSLLGIDGVSSWDAGATDGGLSNDGRADGPRDADAGVVTDGAADEKTGGDVEAETIVYVSNTEGNDTNDGLSPSSPKQTIAAALVAAGKLGTGVKVHVCAGVYEEAALNVSSQVALLGAWSCSTWSRTTNYGYPGFDGVNATVIQSKNPLAQEATLAVTGSVSSSTIIDGFVIQGAATSTATTSAIETSDTASPFISNDMINGGAGNGAVSTVGSIGIHVSGNSSPEIVSCSVSGGAGSGVNGSIGIEVFSGGSPSIHGNTITGGHGTTLSSTGSSTIGLYAFNGAAPSGTVSVDHDSIVANDQPVAAVSMGVDIVGTMTATLSDCSISAGTGASGNMSISIAVRVDTSNTAVVQLEGDRIFGGARDGPTFGIVTQAGAPVKVTDSFIHGGTSSSLATGIQLAETPGSTIAFDTIYSSDGVGVAIQILPGATNTTISDDLLLGGYGHDGGVGLQGTCGTLIGAMDHVAFANLDSGLFFCQQDGSAPLTSVTQTVAVLGAKAANDLIVESTTCQATGDASYCVNYPSCPSKTCLLSLFGSTWTSDDGYSGLFPASSTVTSPTGGWVLASPIACALAHGAAPIAGITTDAFGVTRNSTTPTIGAAEVTGVCD